ncbi:unnamed protein product [Blepharisma stoltei]|uniref:Uncharacterized protein n=1 Tax=Blepharisma stoltei TaxID=1481888 RepID=A0AAU9K8P8_9CILI|nr:unnamed protein product [Blepharisma stoltei]
MCLRFNLSLLQVSVLLHEHKQHKEEQKKPNFRAWSPWEWRKSYRKAAKQRWRNSSTFIAYGFIWIHKRKSAFRSINSSILISPK